MAAPEHSLTEYVRAIQQEHQSWGPEKVLTALEEEVAELGLDVDLPSPATITRIKKKYPPKKDGRGEPLPLARESS